MLERKEEGLEKRLEEDEGGGKDELSQVLVPCFI